jgi:hypothetical protein
MSCGMLSQQEFAVLITSVYNVVWDVEEKMVEIREKVLLNRIKMAKDSGVVFTDHAWKQWPTSSDKNAHALDLSDIFLTQTINRMSDTDKKPTVDEKDIPSMFLDLRLAIMGMQSQVPAVEAEYAVDCSKLRTSMQNAVTQLQAYLSGGCGCGVKAGRRHAGGIEAPWIKEIMFHFNLFCRSVVLYNKCVPFTECVPFKEYRCGGGFLF